MDHILTNSEFLTACAALCEVCYENLWQIFMFCCSFNDCEWFLFSLTKFLFYGPYICNIKVNFFEYFEYIFNHNFQYLPKCVITESICSAMQSIISWWLKIFLLLFITFWTKIWMSITHLPMLICIYSSFSVDKISRIYKISNVVCIFATWVPV